MHTNGGGSFPAKTRLSGCMCIERQQNIDNSMKPHQSVTVDGDRICTADLSKESKRQIGREQK